MSESATLLPDKVHLDDHIILKRLAKDGMNEIKMMHQVIFPVKYSPSYFEDLLKPEALSYLVMYNNLAVGCLSAVFQDDLLYIKSIGVLPTYRNLGIGTKMMQWIVKELNKTVYSIPIELHIHVANRKGLRFYRKFGFEIVETITGFYRRLEPKEAYLLRLNANK